MREIKFRAWDGRRMILPRDKAYYQHYLSFCGSIVQSSREGMLDFGDQWGVIRDLKIMQYTGLKDKNGVYIYEGDLLDQKYKWRVMFYKGCFIIKDLGKYGLNFNSLYELIEFRERAGIPVEVIGNIYENPELLEANHD